MRLIELVDKLLTLAHESDNSADWLNAHVEVHGHDGSWAWVNDARPLRLTDSEGVTRTIVIGVDNRGVRMPTQPIGKPPSSYPVEHKKED